MDAGTAALQLRSEEGTQEQLPTASPRCSMCRKDRDFQQNINYRGGPLGPTPASASSLQSPGITSLPMAPTLACPGPAVNAFQLLQMGAKKGQNPQIKLFYAQLAAEELLSAFSAFTSPLCLLVPDD